MASTRMVCADGRRSRVILSMMALPLALRQVIVLVMFIGVIFTFADRLRARHIALRLTSFARNFRPSLRDRGLG